MDRSCLFNMVSRNVGHVVELEMALFWTSADTALLEAPSDWTRSATKGPDR